MFIAMNRFRVAKGSEAAFEQVWLSRDSHLDKVPGFVEFPLLVDCSSLYRSTTTEPSCARCKWCARATVRTLRVWRSFAD
jgi:Antibiotic biosynthesis monooxygenase